MCDFAFRSPTGKGFVVGIVTGPGFELVRTENRVTEFAELVSLKRLREEVRELFARRAILKPHVLVNNDLL